MAGLVEEPRLGRRKHHPVLSDGKRAQLTRRAKRAKTAQFLARRDPAAIRLLGAARDTVKPTTACGGRRNAVRAAPAESPHVGKRPDMAQLLAARAAPAPAIASQATYVTVSSPILPLM